MASCPVWQLAVGKFNRWTVREKTDGQLDNLRATFGVKILSWSKP